MEVDTVNQLGGLFQTSAAARAHIAFVNPGNIWKQHALLPMSLAPWDKSVEGESCLHRLCTWRLLTSIDIPYGRGGKKLESYSVIMTRNSLCVGS